MSVQLVNPVPVYPAGQLEHEKEPSLLTQFVSTSQPPLLLTHSLMSKQRDAPVPEKTGRETTEKEKPEKSEGKKEERKRRYISEP
jgi:hypothetical protein